MDMEPLTAARLARLTSDAPVATVYIRMPVDLPGVAEAGDLVHCRAEIDDDGDIVLSAFGSADYDPQPMRPWPLPDKVDNESNHETPGQGDQDG